MWRSVWICLYGYTCSTVVRVEEMDRGANRPHMKSGFKYNKLLLMKITYVNKMWNRGNRKESRLHFQFG